MLLDGWAQFVMVVPHRSIRATMRSALGRPQEVAIQPPPLPCRHVPAIIAYPFSLLNTSRLSMRDCGTYNRSLPSLPTQGLSTSPFSRPRRRLHSIPRPFLPAASVASPLFHQAVAARSGLDALNTTCLAAASSYRHLFASYSLPYLPRFATSALVAGMISKRNKYRLKSTYEYPIRYHTCGIWLR